MSSFFFLSELGLIHTQHFLIAAAVAFGFLAGTICNFATQLKFVLGYDDALDVRSPE